MTKMPQKADLMGSAGGEFFIKLKETTNGMLAASIYRKMYKLSLEQCRGPIIDIGVGQGPSSIVFALGVAHSGRSDKVHVIDQFEQVRVGPHKYSMTDLPDGCREANTEVFKNHMKAYGVEGITDVHPGRTDEVHGDFGEDVMADILSIDADGNIDRDFALYFDKVLLGGWIIVDDYADFIDRTGRSNLERFSDMNTSQVRAKWAGMSSLDRRRTLGKHLLIYILANAIEATGAIVKKQVMGSTAFYVKTSSRKFSKIMKIDAAELEEKLLKRLLTELSKQKDV